MQNKVTKKERKKQIINQKKKDLYEKYLTSQKGLTRKQIGRHWQRYREKKFVITELPKYRTKLAKARDEMHAAYLRERYFERKELKKYKSEYENLRPTKRITQKFSKQHYYNVKKDADVNKIVNNIFSDKKREVRYVLVILKIRLKDTGQVVHASDVFTKEKFNRVLESKKDIVKLVLEKLSFTGKYEGELISVHIRVVYEIPEKS